jgi:hypothetical protein
MTIIQNSGENKTILTVKNSTRHIAMKRPIDVNTNNSLINPPTFFTNF